MDQKILENQDPSHKVGVKYLDQRQIENTFPDYPALLERIRDQRRIADYVDNLPSPDFRYCQTQMYDNPQQNFEYRQTQMYDNVYAILGGRGTGKSSVLLTLRERLLRESDYQDIVFPIITPEAIIGNKCSIIGWIMSITEQMVARIEKRVQLAADRDMRLVSETLRGIQMDFFKDCHFHKDNRLREHYQNLMRDCIQDDIPLSSYSFDEMVGLQVHLSQKHYKLIHKLNAFWYEMADSWYALNIVEKKLRGIYRSNTPIPRPLIILLFDDIDLVPERSMELLNTTFQYFTNSNIVLVLTAAEKTLRRVIWMKMLERLSGSNYNSLLVDFFQKQPVQSLAESEAGNGRAEAFSLDFVDRMEMEYYDKVIPPSSRFYLRRFRTISERKHYRYASTGQSFEIPTDNESKPLGNFLIEQIHNLISTFRNDTSEGKGGFKDGLQRENFLVSTNGEMREAYFLMFGDKNRNISNGCLGILNCISRLQQLVVEKRSERFTEPERSKIVTALRHLLQTLLLSKKEVSKFHDSVDQFLYQRGPYREIYVDYQHVWNMYIHKREELRKQIQEDRQKLQARSSEESFFSIENYLADKEQHILGDLQQQIAVLFVMLLFVENLSIILEPVYYNDTDDYQIMEKRTLGGSRELASLLNADVFGMQESKARTNIVGVFKPFSDHQSAVELLDRSPLLLEHIKQYVGFQPFDLPHTQIYLMDTFYVVDITGEQPSVDRLKCFLQKRLEDDKDWVRSVLKMLFIRYSGITFIKEDFINFHIESRRRLGQIGIGGWLNREIQKELITSIKDGVFIGQNRAQTTEKIKALGNLLQSQDTSKEESAVPKSSKKKKVEKVLKDLKTFLNSFSPYLELSITELDNYFEQKWLRESTNAFLDTFTCCAWSSWPHRQDLSDPLVILVQFVESNIKALSQILVQECDIKLSRENYQKIIDLLNDMPDISIYLSQKRVQFVSNLREQALKTDKENDTNKNIIVPMQILSDYLYELQDFLFYRDVLDEDESLMSYYKPQMIKTYFALLELIVPYAPKSSVQLDSSSAQCIQGHDYSFVIKVQYNLWFVLVIRMTAKLLPLYFAAKFELNYRNTLPGETSLLNEANCYPQEHAVDEDLKNLYHSLIARDSSNQELQRLMRDISHELTDQYISQLGGNI